MRCTKCGGSTVSVAPISYVGTDSYEHVQCTSCETTYEVVRDCLTGGEPTLTVID